MNNKGFTLIELLAVVVILALIIIVVATNGFGVFDSAKKSISEENEKVIIEGAKTLLVEIDNCEILNDSKINELLTINGTSCLKTSENKSICNNNELKNKIDTCNSTLLESYGYTEITCDDINCDFSDQCFEVTLEYLKSNNYVSGKGIDDVTDTPGNYNVNICLNGSITLP